MKLNNIVKFIICMALLLKFSLLSMSFTASAETNTSQSKLIALTFDDGPNTTTTNEVLDVLEEYNAVASFFLVGDNINDKSAVTVKRAYDMGCEIDNHSKTHSNMSNMTEKELLAEIEYVDNYVFEITGEYTKFFRPPYVDANQNMYNIIDKPFICGVGCNDFIDSVTAQERANNVISSAKDGLIVLLHDAKGNSQTVEALKTIIPTLQKEGYEFVTLTDLFEKQGETPARTQLYSEVTKYPCGNYTIYKNTFTGEVTGDTSSKEWGKTTVFDGTELESLKDTYAIEVSYTGVYQPVIALQKWSGEALFCSVQPSYYNGRKACFLATDIQKALAENNVNYTNLNRISIIPYGGTLTITNIDLLVKKNIENNLSGDVNEDQIFSIADVVMMQKYLLNSGTLINWKAGDLYMNDYIDIFDLCIMKQKLINQTQKQ
ncbi:MAG: polysaccharide deacetylase family protein [Ruminococcus sp.]|nr:polysaccharide deacetylase family protein [Ruminococcus sp.]